MYLSSYEKKLLSKIVFYSEYAAASITEVEDISKLKDRLYWSGLIHHLSAPEHNEYCKEKLFDGKKKLFLGSGPYSLVDINNLHKRLNFAISELGGEQQNGGMGHEYDEQSGKEAEQNIKDVLRDIIHAFGYEPGDL